MAIKPVPMKLPGESGSSDAAAIAAAGWRMGTNRVPAGRAKDFATSSTSIEAEYSGGTTGAGYWSERQAARAISNAIT
jgi:hypothetical protein